MRLNSLSSATTSSGSSWTSWFSEESPSGVTCPSGTVVNQVSCKGGYCDDKALLCTSIPSGYQLGVASWGSWFSEETANGYTCPDTKVVIGWKCRGRNCDDNSLLCASMSKAIVCYFSCVIVLSLPDLLCLSTWTSALSQPHPWVPLLCAPHALVRLLALMFLYGFRLIPVWSPNSGMQWIPGGKL